MKRDYLVDAFEVNRYLQPDKTQIKPDDRRAWDEIFMRPPTMGIFTSSLNFIDLPEGMGDRAIHRELGYTYGRLIDLFRENDAVKWLPRPDRLFKTGEIPNSRVNEVVPPKKYVERIEHKKVCNIDYFDYFEFEKLVLEHIRRLRRKCHPFRMKRQYFEMYEEQIAREVTKILYSELPFDIGCEDEYLNLMCRIEEVIINNLPNKQDPVVKEIDWQSFFEALAIRVYEHPANMRELYNRKASDVMSVANVVMADKIPDKNKVAEYIMYLLVGLENGETILIEEEVLSMRCSADSASTIYDLLDFLGSYNLIDYEFIDDDYHNSALEGHPCLVEKLGPISMDLVGAVS